MAAYGLSADTFDDALATAEGPDCEIWPENWDTVMVFLACGTCWRREIPAMSGVIIYHGMRYTDVDVVIRRHGHTGQQADEIFRGIQTMETAALPVLNKAT